MTVESIADSGRAAGPRQKGITLMELMVAMTIVAILAAIAYPSYLEQVRKTRRADGRSALVDVAQQLERCYSTFGTYNNGNCPAVADLTDGDGVDSEENYYNLVAETAAGAASLAATAFTLRATPLGSQADDDRCTIMTLDNAGVRAAQDSSGSDSTSYCW